MRLLLWFAGSFAPPVGLIGAKDPFILAHLATLERK